MNTMMQSERTKNSGRTLVFGIISKILILLLPFATRTIIIYKLGIEYAGLSSLFTSILSILSITELGLNSAITFCLYEPVSKNDVVKINALLNLLKKMYFLVGGVILVAGLAIMPFLNYFITGNVPNDVNIFILYGMYLFSTVVSYFSFAYKNTLFNVYQRGDVEYKIVSITEITKCVLQIVLILIFKNYYIFVACLAISSIVNIVLVGFVSKKMFPLLRPKGNVDIETKKTIAKKVGALATHSILTKIVSSIDSIVISSFIGLVGIGIYGNYMYIYNAIIGFILIIVSSIRPSIANHMLTNSSEEANKIYRMVSFAFRWIVIFCATSLLCLFQPFVKVWVGENQLLSFSIVITIVGRFALNSFSQLYSSCYVATNGLWIKTLPFVITASLINLVLDFVLIRYIGILGITLATLAYNIIVYPVEIIVVYKYILKIPLKTIVITILNDILLLAAISSITYLACYFIDFGNILTLLVDILICIILPNGIYILLFFKTNNFRELFRHLKSLRRRT